MKKFFVVSFLPIILFGAFITIPTFLLTSDIWDGVMIEYASEIQEYSGLKNWFFESTWYLQYPFVVGVIYLSELFGTSYKNFNAIATLILMIFLLYEVFIFSERQVRLNKISIFMAVACVATFPTWSALLSSVLTFHLFCTAIGLFAVRLIHATGMARKIIALLVIAAAFSLKSQLVFLPILSYIYDINKNSKRNYFLVSPGIETILIFLLGLIFYNVIRIIYPPTGIYEAYYPLIITNINGILPAILRGLQLATYLIPLAMATLFFLIFNITLRHTQNNLPRYSVDSNEGPRNLLLWMFVLFLAGAFPYLAVGASSILWEVNDWVGRQAFLLAFPTAVLTALLLQVLHHSANNASSKRLIFLLGFAILFFNLTLLTYGVLAKYNRQFFVSQIQEIMKSKEAELPPGLIQIVGKKFPATVFEFYEPNYAMYKATGKSLWWVRFGEHIDYDFTIPCFMGQLKEYQYQYVYTHDPTRDVNHTLITIQAQGFEGVSNMFRNTFRLNAHGSIKVVSIERINAKDQSFEVICR